MTGIMSAKHVFTSELYGAMRSLGITTQKSRRRVWMIDGDLSHHFDFALPGHYEVFQDYAAEIMRRAADKKAARR